MVGEISPQRKSFLFRKILLKFFLKLLFPLWGLGGFLLSGGDCFAQRLPYTFDQFKINDSSFDNFIICMLKDSKGYLWLGTINGLKRYNSNFTIDFKRDKNNKNTIPNNYIQAIAEDKQGRIWVGTDEGVCYFDRKTNQFTQFEETVKPDFVCRNILCDSRGDVWFTIRDRGLYKFDTKTNKLSNFKHKLTNPQSLSHNRIVVKGLIEDPYQKGLWIACMDKLNYFDFATQTFHHSNHNPRKIKVLDNQNKSALTIEQNLLVYSDNSTKEIDWYDTRQQKIIKTFKVIDKKGNILTDFYQIFFDSNHDLWLSTYDTKMAFVDAKLQNVIPIKHEKGNPISFSSNWFIDIFQEKNGTIWFATNNGISIVNGMAVLNPNNQLFNVYDFSKNAFEKNTDDKLIDFAEDSKDSTWWFVTAKNQLLNYNPQEDTYRQWNIPFDPHLGIWDVSKILSQYEDKILIFKTLKFYIFDKKTHKLENIKLIDEINNLSQGRISHTKIVGDSVWVFTKSKAAPKAYNYHFKKKRWTIYPIVYGKNVMLNLTQEVGVMMSLITKSDDFWLAIHSGGLAKFNPQKKVFEVIKTKQNIDFTKIGYNGFSEDNDGNIWIASHDLIKFNPKTYDFKSVLDVGLINSMVVDKNDNICMNRLDEIFFFNEKKNEKFTFRFELNNSIEQWENRLYQLKNAKILSVNKQAAVLVNFKNLLIPSSNDQLYIHQIGAADTTVFINENNSTVSLKKNQNAFTIHYGILTPPNTDLYDFFYQLEGFDKDWRQDKTSSKYVSYGNLDGGDYIFKVKARDTNGKYLPTQSLYIHINTPFYKTLWFRVLGFILAIGLGLAFIRFRTNKRKEIHHLQLQSTRLEKDKTEIQYQNLINHLNPHFLFNSLTSLNGLILSEPDIASDFLQKLSKIYRYILQNKDNEVVSLEQELEFVQNYIDLQKSRFEDGLQVIIDIHEDYLSSGIVPVTLQNLFENAIKHNTVEEDKPLIIRVYVEGNYLMVKNNLQKKKFVETSNKQGLDSLKSLYKYLTNNPLETIETENEFVVRVPLL
jgi:ligand-binding sensor domain-containing protein